MSAQLFAWAILAWFAFVFARTLLPIVSQLDRERRDAPMRSWRRFGLILVAAVLEATGIGCVAAAMFAFLGFVYTAGQGFVQ